MPSLTKEDRQALLGPLGYKCNKCNSSVYRSYCRECDEFFHECLCELNDVDDVDHRDHRNYRWWEKDERA